jgi:hypothetical protein
MAGHLYWPGTVSTSGHSFSAIDGTNADVVNSKPVCVPVARLTVTGYTELIRQDAPAAATSSLLKSVVPLPMA